MPSPPVIRFLVGTSFPWRGGRKTAFGSGFAQPRCGAVGVIVTSSETVEQRVSSHVPNTTRLGLPSFPTLG